MSLWEEDNMKTFVMDLRAAIVCSTAMKKFKKDNAETYDQSLRCFVETRFYLEVCVCE